MKESSELIKNTAGLQKIETPVESAAHVPVMDRYYGEQDTEEGGYSRLHDYLRSARKHVWMITGIAVLVTTVSAIYVARQPDIYEAQARVQVDLENTNPALGAFKSGSVIVNNPGQDPTYFNTQLEILSSAGLLSRVIKTLDLENNQAFLHPQSVQTRPTWQSLRRMIGLGGKERDEGKATSLDKMPRTSSIAPATSREDLVEVNRLEPFVNALQSGLSVKQLSDTRLISIRFKHPDPDVAAKIANAIADSFVLSNLEKRTETSSTAGDFLQRRIAELQVEIRNREEQLINYAKNHQILSLDAGQNTVVDRLAGLNKQLLEAENERKLAEATYRASLAPGAAEALSDDAAKQAAQSESRLNELRQRRAQLLVEYTEKYPEIKEIDQQTAVLEKQIKDSRRHATSVVTTNLETRYRQALAREQALQSAFDKQRGETLAQNEAAVNYRIIQQEIETNKTLLDGLLQRAKENDVALAGTPNNIHILDYAPVPKIPVGPKRLQGIILGLIISLVLGVALARYLEYLDDSVHSVEDVEKYLRLPALATIPAAASLKGKRRLLPGLVSLQNRNGNDNPELLLNTSARSPLAEAYRQLRTSVLLSSAGGAPQTLLVTSSQPAEGKTTTAINTALILEQTGANVLVIDADMRRPRLHTILELENERGLSTILASKMAEAEMLSMIGQHESSGLYTLTSGPVPPNPAELIGSEQMGRLIALVKSSFTHVVIDSPPIASFTDGVLLSSMVDGVLLVVQSDKASRAMVRRSRQLLLDVGAKIVGVVLNKVNLSHHDYYYNYYHRSYYGAEADEDSMASSTLGLDQ